MTLDRTLLSHDLLQCPPSQLAIASIAITRKALGRHTWSPTLLKRAQCREEEILPVTAAILAQKSLLSCQALKGIERKHSRIQTAWILGENLDLCWVFEIPLDTISRELQCHQVELQ